MTITFLYFCNIPAIIVYQYTHMFVNKYIHGVPEVTDPFNLLIKHKL